MRILISTIIRNRAQHITSWANQLLRLNESNPNIKFDLVVFENDSTDLTKELLKGELIELLKAKLNNVIIETADLKWPYFGSIKSGERVIYLAAARNKTLTLAQKHFGLDVYDKILCVEPDARYQPDISKLLYTDNDIASGYSVLPFGHGVPDWIYDSWATRVKSTDSEYFGPKISELPDELKVASTFNCFCVYNAKPFVEGIKFSSLNPYTNDWDCDTTNICFEFAKAGYDDIAMHKIEVLHMP